MSFLFANGTELIYPFESLNGEKWHILKKLRASRGFPTDFKLGPGSVKLSQKNSSNPTEQVTLVIMF